MPDVYGLDEQGMMDAYLKSKQKTEEKKSDNSIFQIREDKIDVFRLLPPPASSLRRIPFLESMKHFLTLPDGKKTVVNCTLDTEGRCPICSLTANIKAKARYTQDKSEKDRLYQEASNVKCQTSYFYTVLNEQNEVGFIDAPPKLHNEIGDQLDTLRKIMKDDFITPFDLIKGRFVGIKKQKKDKGPGFWEWIYTVTFFPNITALQQEFIANYDSLWKDPSVMIKKYTVQDLEKAVLGDFSFIQQSNSSDEQSTVPVQPTPAPVSASPVPAQAQTKQTVLNDHIDQTIEDILNS